MMLDFKESAEARRNIAVREIECSYIEGVCQK